MFEAAYAIALTEVREDCAKRAFPDRWPLSQAIDDLWSAAYRAN